MLMYNAIETEFVPEAGVEISESIILDCDTEFIHFSESIDICSDENDETVFINLENYQPSVPHQHFVEKLEKLKLGKNDTRTLLQQTKILQQTYQIESQQQQPSQNESQEVVAEETESPTNFSNQQENK